MLVVKNKKIFLLHIPSFETKITVLDVDVDGLNIYLGWRVVWGEWKYNLVKVLYIFLGSKLFVWVIIQIMENA